MTLPARHTAGYCSGIGRGGEGRGRVGQRGGGEGGGRGGRRGGEGEVGVSRGVGQGRRHESRLEEQ